MSENKFVTWKLPKEVSIDQFHGQPCLVGSSDDDEYPLTEAVGGAFDMIAKCQSQEDAIEFTKSWGFLYEKERLGALAEERPRFPVQLFLLWVDELLALAGLSSALRDAKVVAIAVVGETVALDKAIKRFWDCVDERDRLREILLPEWSRPDNELKGLYRDPLFGLLTVEEQRAFHGKFGPIAPRHSLKPFVERSVPETSEGYAAHLLAAMFSALPQLELVPVQTGPDRWKVVDIPGIYSLDQIILWDLRKRLDTILHQTCEACGKSFIPVRKHKRFCSNNCGTRMRMRKKRARDQLLTG